MTSGQARQQVFPRFRLGKNGLRPHHLPSSLMTKLLIGPPGTDPRSYLSVSVAISVPTGLNDPRDSALDALDQRVGIAIRECPLRDILEFAICAARREAGIRRLEWKGQ